MRTDYECGVELKTRTCTRAPLWPGGRCPRHGYGAENLEQWIRGLARAEAEAGRVVGQTVSVTIYARAEWVELDHGNADAIESEFRERLNNSSFSTDLKEKLLAAYLRERFSNSVGLEWREDLPAHARLVVKWSASTRRTTIMSGEMDVDAAAVLADLLEVSGLTSDPRVMQLREQIALVVRAKLRRGGADDEAAAAAALVRNAGIFAHAVDDMLVIPRDSIASLVAALKTAHG